MSENTPSFLTRRDAMKRGGKIAAASALAGVSIPHVHAAGDNTVRLALIGCGGRGTGAVGNALSVAAERDPIELHAMADVYEDKMARSYDTLTNERRGTAAKRIKVDPERKFIGFEGYRSAMDTLRPGDVVILTTPLAFRWPMFEYAIEKGLNVFMEKPVTADGPASRKMLELSKKADAKNLKVGVGLMCRHCDARGELHKRIENGEIGDIQMMRAYRMQAPIGSCFSSPKNDDSLSELMWQIRRFHSFLWLSGGSYSDFFIHNVDECCWMKNDWPVEARAVGGRTFRGDNVDQNLDSYSVEYTFKDGTKLFLDGRNLKGCHNEFASYAHGTKGSAVISTSAHTPARCRMFKDQHIEYNWRKPADNMTWAYPQDPRERSPYDIEWEHLMDAIRNDKPYNEVPRGVQASAVTSMGRMAAHTGQVITYDEFMACDHEFGAGVKELTSFDDPSPLQADADGKYPVPEPGVKKDREY